MHRSRQPRLSRALPWFRQCLASDPHATRPFHMAFPHLKSVILIPLASHLPPFCHRGTSVSTHKPTSLQPQSPRPGLLQKSATKPAAPRRLCLVLPCTKTIVVFHLATPPRNIPSSIHFLFPHRSCRVVDKSKVVEPCTLQPSDAYCAQCGEKASRWLATQHQGRQVPMDDSGSPLKLLQAILASPVSRGGWQKRGNVASTWGPGLWDLDRG